MNDLQLLDQREVLGKEFRIYGDAENPIFLAKDVAVWIAHSNPAVMLQNIDENEKVINNVYTLGGNQDASNGYTQSKTHVIDADRSVIHTYWTQKGRLSLYDLLKNKRGILPVIERASQTA